MTETETETETLDLSVQLMRAQALLVRRFDRCLSSVHGVAFSDFVLLLQLYREPGGRMRRVDLAERLAVSASGVTRSLGPLERIGLVAREAHPRDARVGYASLTDVGRERVEEMLVTAQDMGDQLLGTLRAKDRAALAASLDRLVAAVAV